MGSDFYPLSIIPSIEMWSTSLGESSIRHITEPEGNWSELTFAKTSGTDAGNRIKNWPIADRRDSNEPRSLCKQLSKVALSQLYGHLRVLGIPILKTVVIFASPVTLTLTLTQFAKVIREGGAYIVRDYE